jgi:predicted metalloprotease
VNFPTGANQATLQAESLSKDLDGKFKSEEAVNNLVSAVEYLDNNPALKDKIKAEGTQFVLDKCGMAKVGQLWGDFLAQLTAEKPA